MQGSRRDHAKCNPSRRLERTRSPPARGRGLKLYNGGSAAGDGDVAPRAGARIETYSMCIETLSPALWRSRVAPRAGARIETFGHDAGDADTRHSRVAPRAGARIETKSWRGRGLQGTHVAPRAGARIETPKSATSVVRSDGMSPPARGRGLKRNNSFRSRLETVGSPPARGRGLKHCSGGCARDKIRGVRSCRPPRGGAD